MSDHIIPFDIQVEILKKLPVKPLITFRSVSKQYKSLIDSPGFISGYGVRDNHGLLVSYKDDVAQAVKKYVCIVDDCILSQQEFGPSVPDELNQTFNNLHLVGMSHGLLCLHGFNLEEQFSKGIVILWNLSIKKTIRITSPGEFGWSKFPALVGFGVCPLTKDPVVVKSIYFLRTWQVEIFTMSSGIWKTVPSSNLPALESVEMTRSQVVIDRFLYWGFFRYKKTSPVTSSRILSFDLTTKEFGILDLPDSLKQQTSSSLTISKIKESLVVIENNKDIQNPACVVWILMEQGLARSFTKLFTINTPVSSLLGFKRNGDPIIVAPGPAALQPHENLGSLQVYERCSHNAFSLGICGLAKSFFVGPYMETLILLDQPDGFMY